MKENSLRKVSPYIKKDEIKFCIGQCNREYVPSEGEIKLVCTSCERVLKTITIQKNS